MADPELTRNFDPVVAAFHAAMGMEYHGEASKIDDAEKAAVCSGIQDFAEKYCEQIAEHVRINEQARAFDDLGRQFRGEKKPVQLPPVRNFHGMTAATTMGSTHLNPSRGMFQSVTGRVQSGMSLEDALSSSKEDIDKAVHGESIGQKLAAAWDQLRGKFTRKGSDD